ncbi:MAG TPA: amidohydrolase family protein [Mycobacterium sp.]|uniref:Probable antibiotic-resistance protein n=1 Tax=Rhodococcus wratislaviensis TaxID=44752 RepID=A0A402C3C3_RHOWR|nr:amidohydrolase family protein [Rhodococcus wratislaviensis]GCE38130.1 probable antibiotic-resistance protein [Rhodococcus wratislaviensis]HJT95404.1 amidohydrolase family protein [Mycobacterium sp.]
MTTSEAVPSRYTYGIDTAELVAIDFHTHVEVDSCGHRALDDALVEASAKYFKTGTVDRIASIEKIADTYRERKMAAVVFTVDGLSATGHPVNSIEEIAEYAARNNDVLIPFGSVDPHQGKAATRKARTLLERHGVKGFKFHPSVQAFEPNDRAYYPLYELLAEHQVPALFHTGQTGIGAGLPGGHGIKLRYSDPMLLDDVAADFPELPIVMAHPAVPWMDSQISIATHKSNVYIDLSGWSPKYFPPQLIRAANTFLRDKLLFGSDYPVLHVDRWMADFHDLDIKPDVIPSILKNNALRVLGIGQ